MEAANVFRAGDHSGGDAQVLERVRDLDVVDHAAADEGYFAAYAGGDVDDLLDAVDGGSETRQDNTPRGGAAKILKARDYGAFGRSEAGALHVCRVAEQGQDAFVTVTRERV